MNFIEWLFNSVLGRHLATSEEDDQRIGPLTGLSLLGLDALTSSAYGPELTLTILLPIGAMGIHYVVPVTLAIVTLLFIVFISYRQTIHAYPSGGGSYTVAKENLGKVPGLLAAAALLIDYILTVAVGVSAGVGALISAIPSLQSHTLLICLLILTLLTVVNLRGIKESGLAFMVPTYAFVCSLLAVLGYGMVRFFLEGGHPQPMEAMPSPGPTTEMLTAWMMTKAFASGCAAMTGIEAVSNGTRAFREPVVDNARRTLTAIVLILISLLLGIAFLANGFNLAATEPGVAGYESLLSQLIRAIAGRGIVYYFTMGAVITVLALSANTSFADFPRLCQILARDSYLPQAFAERGRRLVFSYGVIVLALLSGVLLIAFGGITDRLIPLYAIGAFLAFTLSQSGMVMHWWREPGRPWHLLLINLLGAIATAITLVIVFVSKFAEGAWITGLIIPVFLLLFINVRRHYLSVARELSCKEPLRYIPGLQPIVIVPIRGWSKLTRKALRFATELSDDVYGVHVESEGNSGAILQTQWQNYVLNPANEAKVVAPKLVCLPSPYRRLFGSFLDFIDELEEKYPERRIAVVIPNLAEHRWYHWLLHNQRAVLLNAALFLRNDPKIVWITVPWHLKN